MQNLIPLKVVEGEKRVDSREIAKELGVENSSVIRVIKTYKNDFEEFGIIGFEIGLIPKKNGKKSRGRPEVFSYLNKEHANLYLTYSKNTFEARQFKKKLVRTFAYYERALARQAANQGKLAWQQARIEGKITRREETDTIKIFVEYAITQGSRNAQMYYVNISKMVNKSLFFLEQAIEKPNNFRDILSRMQLVHLDVADNLVSKALEKGMEQGMFYKDIYKLAKERVETFAGFIGKTSIIETGEPTMALVE